MLQFSVGIAHPIYLSRQSLRLVIIRQATTMENANVGYRIGEPSDVIAQLSKLIAYLPDSELNFLDNDET